MTETVEDLADVFVGGPHVFAHNEERSAINALRESMAGKAELDEVATKLGSPLNLRDYLSADPNGTIDNTADIDRCFADARAQDRAIYIRGYGSAKPYVYNGVGTQIDKPVLVGDGFRKTFIKLGGSALAALVTQPVDGSGNALGLGAGMFISGISTIGGFGICRLDYTGGQCNAATWHIIEDCYGTGYWGAWVSTRAPLTCNFKITAKLTNSIGWAWAIVMAGQSDASEWNIVTNGTRRGFKFGSEVPGGHSTAGPRITGQYSVNDDSEGNRIAAWFVPDKPTVNPGSSGQGGAVFSNFRFSLEHTFASDKKILVADQNHASGLLWAGANTVFRVNVDTGSGPVATSNMTASTLLPATLKDRIETALNTALGGSAGVGMVRISRGPTVVTEDAAAPPPADPQPIPDPAPGGPWHFALDESLRETVITVTTVSGTPAQWVSDERTQEPLYTIPSTGIMGTPIITDEACWFGGRENPSGPILYTTCSGVDYTLKGRLRNAKPTEIVHYEPEASVGRVSDKNDSICVVGPLIPDKISNTKATMKPSNVAAMIDVVDPYGLFSHRPEVVLPFGVSNHTGLVEVVSDTSTMAAKDAGTTLTPSQVDGIGGTDAVQAAFGNSSTYAYIPATAAMGLVQDKPLWLEFDVGPPASGTPAADLVVKITDAADDTKIFFQRTVPVTTEWNTYLYRASLPTVPAGGVRIWWRRSTDTVAVAANIGRVQLYHSRRPKYREIGARKEMTMRANGLITENYSGELIAGGSALLAGNIYGWMVGLKANEIVNFIDMALITAAVGANATLLKFGLVDPQGLMCALSANDVANARWFTGNSFVHIPTLATYKSKYPGAYTVVALLVGAYGSTQPAFGRAQVLANAAISAPIGAATRRRIGIFGTGATDLPAIGQPLPTPAGIGTNVNAWAGLSK